MKKGLILGLVIGVFLLGQVDLVWAWGFFGKAVGKVISQVLNSAKGEWEKPSSGSFSNPVIEQDQALIESSRVKIMSVDPEDNEINQEATISEIDSLIRSYRKDRLTDAISKLSAPEKEYLIKPLLDICTDPAEDRWVTIYTLIALEKVALDPEVNSVIKESIVEPMMDIAKNVEGGDFIREQSIGILGNITSDPEVSLVIKESMVKPLGDVVKGNEEPGNVRTGAITVLAIIIFNPEVDESLKEDIVNILEEAVKISSESKSSMHAQITSVSKLGDIASNDCLSDSLRKKAIDGLKNIIKGGSHENQFAVRQHAMDVLGSIVPEVPDSIDGLLDMITPDTHPALIAKCVQVLRGLSNDVDASQKQYIKDKVSALGVINEENKKIWDEFDVIILNNSGEGSIPAHYSAIYALLSSLPPEMLPAVVSIEDFVIFGAGGNYQPGSTLIEVLFHSDSIYMAEYALAHETGHYVHLSQLTPEQGNEWRELWEQSDDVYDTADPIFHGRISLQSETEDFAYMFCKYICDGGGLFYKAKRNAEEYTDDLFLQKLAFMTGLFAHTITLPDGTPQEVTYIYKVERKRPNTLIRKEVALTEQEIKVGEDEKTYLLPDWNTVYSETTFLLDP